MSVDINGTHLVFDSDGNPNIGYNVVEWVWKDSGLVDFMEVGSFNKKLDINSSLFKWHTPNSQVIMASFQEIDVKLHYLTWFNV